MLGAILTVEISSSAIFVDILRHLFIYQRLMLGLFTPRDRLGQGYPPYLLTYYVICLRVEVRLDAILSAENRSSAIFVDILRHLFTCQMLMLGLFTPCDRQGHGYPPYL